MIVPPQIRPRIASLIRLIASDQDGEALGACRAIGRTLKAAGSDLHALANEIEAGPSVIMHVDWPDRSRTPSAAAWSQTAQWLNQRSDSFKPNERKFVSDMASLWRGRQPTAKQAEWLQAIYDRLNEAAA